MSDGMLDPEEASLPADFPADPEVPEKPEKKPPIGLTPVSILVKDRCFEIVEDIRRYSKARRNIPSEWLDELHDHLQKYL